MKNKMLQAIIKMQCDKQGIFGEKVGFKWPRERCPDPDRNAVSSSLQSPLLSSFVPNDEVPAGVASAVCEMARELLIVDRTAAAPGEGISSTQTSSATTIQPAGRARRAARPTARRTRGRLCRESPRPCSRSMAR